MSDKIWDDACEPAPPAPVAPEGVTVCTGFLVTIKVHTKDGLEKLSHPENVRHKIGYAFDHMGLQEECDYTLEVARTYENR